VVAPVHLHQLGDRQIDLDAALLQHDPHLLAQLAAGGGRVDPQDTGDDEANEVLVSALPKLTEAAGATVRGSLGDAEPLSAIQDAVNLGHYDEIIISTLPPRISRWLKLDLVSKTRALGLPVAHVEAEGKVEATAGLAEN